MWLLSPQSKHHLSKQPLDRRCQFHLHRPQRLKRQRAPRPLLSPLPLRHPHRRLQSRKRQFFPRAQLSKFKRSIPSTPKRLKPETNSKQRSHSRVIVPKGANVYLRLVAAQTSGQYKGRSQLQLTLVRVEVQGANYPLTSTTYTEAGGSRGSDTAKTVGGGAIVGAIIGAIAGGGKGAAIGGAAGAGAGGVYQGVTKAKQVRVPAETRLDFKLDQPLNIPVTPTNTAQ